MQIFILLTGVKQQFSGSIYLKCTWWLVLLLIIKIQKKKCIFLKKRKKEIDFKIFLETK